MKLSCIPVFLLICTAAVSLAAELKPLMTVPDQVVLKDDFSKSGAFNKQHWGARQGTQWKIEDGVLRGRPSTPEFQAKKKDHFGYEPRISAPVTPPEFVAEFSVRFSGGSETTIAPFIEFGHHVVRVRFSKAGAEMLVDHESTRVAEAKDFQYEPGKWHRALAELKDDEFVIQFENGPTLYVKHECLAKPAPSGGNGFGVAGPKNGTVEIDNVTFWTVKPATQPGWEATRAKLPKFTPVAAKPEPKKKAAKK